MFTIRPTNLQSCHLKSFNPNASSAKKPDIKAHNSVVSISGHGIRPLMLGTTIVMGSILLAGCGQKGGLYLTDASSETVQDSTALVDSTSHPQDAAFAGLGNDKQYNDNQKTDNFKLPEPSSDPNDY